MKTLPLINTTIRIRANCINRIDNQNVRKIEESHSNYESLYKLNISIRNIQQFTFLLLLFFCI